MNNGPNLDSIVGRLSRALSQFVVLPGIRDQFTSPLSSGQLERAARDMFRRKREWLAAVPSLRNVQSWVDVHWVAERQTQPPWGTVSTGDEWGNQGEVQLDALTAACKLLLAAAGHGAETAGRYATEFAAHGMIEVRSFYLLKGQPLSKAKSLDDYCALVPYREALEQVKAAASAQYVEEPRYWPPESADDICALEARSFEHRGLAANDFERRVSRLLQSGPETLALILGLVWGAGFRVFGGWHDVAEPVAATLPFFRTTSGRSAGIQRIPLTLPGFRPRPPSTSRPLNDAELMNLMGQYAARSEQTQRVLSLAMRRLRDSTERMGIEDKVIDVCIALEALFMVEGEEWNQKKKISRRASWYFSDSLREREQTRTLLKDFYDWRSDIVHGNVPDQIAQEEETRHHARLADTEDVVRASLKTMISEGPTQDWEDSKDSRSIRHEPPRAEKDTPSVKSDSLSWSLKEQKEIDQALEAVWKPTVDNAPVPPPDASPVCHHGIVREQIEQYKQQGIYYIIRIPALLYMAHPMWIERADEPLDDHTRYYCERDVNRHLQRWHEAAGEKKLHQFELPLEDAIMYLPKHFDYWRELVSQEPEQGEHP